MLAKCQVLPKLPVWHGSTCLLINYFKKTTRETKTIRNHRNSSSNMSLGKLSFTVLKLGHQMCRFVGISVLGSLVFFNTAHYKLKKKIIFWL